MLPISPSSLWSLYGTPHVELDLQKVCQPARLPLALKQQDIYSMDALPDDAEAAQQRLNTEGNTLRDVCFTGHKCIGIN